MRCFVRGFGTGFVIHVRCRIAALSNVMGRTLAGYLRVIENENQHRTVKA